MPMPAHRCPDCGGTAISGSTRSSLAKAIMALIGRGHYMCRDCGLRFWDRRRRAKT
jgi:predicted RNA-binding Zn-ribbon protein involved in translation (DUF1610 family)